MLIQDISRPDVNTPPKMKPIADLVNQAVNALIPHITVTTDDNLCSSIFVKGNFTPKDQWVNNIYENGKYFIIRISPDKKRYYDPDDSKITIDTIVSKKKFRKYTGPINKVIEKLVAWLKEGV
jgi:hypothetical protein